MINVEEITYTHHMVDDEVSPQDQAMDTFRKAFRLVCDVVDPDGLTMRYRFKTEPLAGMWKASADNIIATLNLPLVAKVDVWKKEGVVFEISLNIIYKPI